MKWALIEHSNQQGCASRPRQSLNVIGRKTCVLHAKTWENVYRHSMDLSCGLQSWKHCKKDLQTRKKCLQQRFFVLAMIWTSFLGHKGIVKRCRPSIGWVPTGSGDFHGLYLCAADEEAKLNQKKLIANECACKKKLLSMKQWSSWPIHSDLAPLSPVLHSSAISPGPQIQSHNFCGILCCWGTATLG